jgi:hypothetical protein
VQGLSLSATTSTRADDLRDLIVKAFAGRSYPGDDRIALSDPRHPGYEGHRVAAFFRGKDWREVAAHGLETGYEGDPTAALRFLRDEGFHYYLPAFLTIALDPHAGDIADAVAYALTAPGSGPAEDRPQFQARMGRLSHEEKKAVTAVLRHLAEREGPGSPAQTALQSFWTSAPA